MPRTSLTHPLPPESLTRPVLHVLVYSEAGYCPVLAALLPHAGAALHLSVVRTMPDLVAHLTAQPTDIVATRVFDEGGDAFAVPSALYRSTLARRMQAKDPHSLQLPDLTTPRLLWYADGRADAMSLHAGALGGVDIYVVDRLDTLVDAIVHASDALAHAMQAGHVHISEACEALSAG